VIKAVVLFLDLFKEQDDGEELERFVEQVKDISAILIRVKDALDEAFILEYVDEKFVELWLHNVEKREDGRESSFVVVSDVLESRNL
jgi:hypothetical protein